MNIQQEYNLNIPQRFIERIWQWNEERELLNGFDGELEYRLLKEEYDELTQAEKDNDIYEQIDAIADIIVVFVGSCIKASLHGINLQDNLSSYKVFESIVETAFHDITKLGYEPSCCFNETLLEVESRTGRLINGKFSKWREGDKEFTGNYKANYELCKLK